MCLKKGTYVQNAEAVTNFQLFFGGERTQRFCVTAKIIPFQGGFCYVNIKQCHLVKEDCLKISCTVYAGKSKVPSMKTARSRLDLHAMDA